MARSACGPKVVYDHDVAGLESESELGRDIGLKDPPVHRCIDDERFGQPIEAQADDEDLANMLSNGDIRRDVCFGPRPAPLQRRRDVRFLSATVALRHGLLALEDDQLAVSDA